MAFKDTGVLEGGCFVDAKLVELNGRRAMDGDLKVHLATASAMFEEKYPGVKPLEILGEWVFMESRTIKYSDGSAQEYGPGHWLHYSLRRPHV